MEALTWEPARSVIDRIGYALPFVPGTLTVFFAVATLQRYLVRGCLLGAKG